VRLYHVLKESGVSSPVERDVFERHLALVRVDAKGDHFESTGQDKKVIDAHDSTFAMPEGSAFGRRPIPLRTTTI